MYDQDRDSLFILDGFPADICYHDIDIVKHCEVNSVLTEELIDASVSVVTLVEIHALVDLECDIDISSDSFSNVCVSDTKCIPDNRFCCVTEEERDVCDNNSGMLAFDYGQTELCNDSNNIQYVSEGSMSMCSNSPRLCSHSVGGLYSQINYRCWQYYLDFETNVEARDYLLEAIRSQGKVSYCRLSGGH